MNVLYGLTQPDEGEILIDGKPAKFGSPRDAIAAGIGMVHQPLHAGAGLHGRDNVTLGIESGDFSRGVWGVVPRGIRSRIGLLDRRKTRRDVADLSHRYGLDVNPDALVEELPVASSSGSRSSRPLVRQAKVLILDEPTAVLTPAETEELVRDEDDRTCRRPSAGDDAEQLLGLRRGEHRRSARRV